MFTYQQTDNDKDGHWEGFCNLANKINLQHLPVLYQFMNLVELVVMLSIIIQSHMDWILSQIVFGGSDTYCYYY